MQSRKHLQNKAERAVLHHRRKRMAQHAYDTIIRNVQLVDAAHDAPMPRDIAILGGKVAAIGLSLDASLAREVIDGKGQLAFPGVVDAHMHTGIYQSLEEDAITESQAAAYGGVTTSLNYMRTGQYYLNKSGPYREFFPEVLALSKGRFHVDYAYHLAPMMASHIGEIEHCVDPLGVTSFKIFMFYGGHGLHGASQDQSKFLMIGEKDRYDLAHFEFIMRGVQAARERMPQAAEHISLGLHCETAEIMRAYTEMVEREGKLEGLAAYHAARPPHSEGLAIFMASYLANETALPNINLLHLTSKKAVDAAMQMQSVFPHINFGREVTVGHLVLDINSKAGAFAKVNPPIRPREDVEYLWERILAGDIHWVVSDHACCRTEYKLHCGQHGHSIFLAKSGFGGTEYLLTTMITEAKRRGLSLGRVAALTAANPAKRFGLPSKGSIAVGRDADIALVDANQSWVVRAADSPSQQGYTPFEGYEMSARVTRTLLRGKTVFADGNMVGEPSGQYLKRPY
jgi:allantoinase